MPVLVLVLVGIAVASFLLGCAVNGAFSSHWSGDIELKVQSGKLPFSLRHLHFSSSKITLQSGDMVSGFRLPNVYAGMIPAIELVSWMTGAGRVLAPIPYSVIRDPMGGVEFEFSSHVKLPADPDAYIQISMYKGTENKKIDFRIGWQKVRVSVEA